MQDGPDLSGREDAADEPHPVETEVKFLAGPEALAGAYTSPLFAPAASPARQLRSAYFDTPGLDLHAAGVVLRIRRGSGGAPLMALKFDTANASALFHRHEIETPCEGPEPDLTRFGKGMARKLHRLTRGLPLNVMFETQVKRRTRTAVSGRSLIEAAFDEGRIVLPDSRAIPVFELELELKSGGPADLYTFARRLARDYPLRLGVTSKSGQGFALLKGETAQPVRAKRLALGGARSGSMVQDIVSAALAQFTGNWQAVRETGTPESIHQLRVGLRRLSTALRMFSRIFPAAEFSTVRERCSAIAGQFGPLRDLDAVIEALSDRDLPDPGCVPGLPLLREEALRRRAAACEAARAVLDGPEVTDFVLGVEGLAASCTMLPLPPRAAAGAMLEWLSKRVHKRGCGLKGQGADDRHRLRIALKDLRYAAGFLESVTGHASQARAMAKRAAQMQDILGRHHDAAVCAAIAADLGGPLGAEGAAAAGYLAGWMARGASGDEDDLMRAWRRFCKCGRFWDA